MDYVSSMKRRHLKALLVEDNPADARLIMECIREAEEDFEFVDPETLSGAIEMLGSDDFDVVLLDLSLPDAHGLEAVRRLCELFPDVPVVVLTGLDDRDVASEAVRSGAQDYIVKGSVDCDVISRAVRYAVERAGLTRALRDNEERLRILFDRAPDPVLVADPDTGVILDANPAASKLFTRPVGELRGMHQSGLHPPEMAEKIKKVFAERMARLQEGGSLDPVEVSVIRPDGSVRTVEIRDEMLRLGGKVVVQAILRDTTERKRYEEALEMSRKSLARAQRIASMGNWDWDIPGNDLRWSDEIYRIFGIERKVFSATYEAFLGFVHPEDRAMVDEAVNSALSEGRAYSIDHRIVLPDGTEKTVHEHGEVELDENGKPARMYGTVQDITGRKAAEEKIRELNGELGRKVEQLEATVTELEAFNHTVSHDLGAPLRIIDGFSKVLLEDHADSLDDNARNYLAIIRKNAGRMRDFIADLLELARIESARMSVREVDMKGLAGAVFAEMEKRSDAPRFVLGDLPPARGEETLLRQVFTNLLSNAVKFTTTREDARIEVGGYADGGENVYYVSDNGAGFDPKHAERLFEVFQRAHSHDDFEGTGVGLAIVRRVVQRHGGRVWAEGKRNQGATFYMTLPAAGGERP